MRNSIQVGSEPSKYTVYTMNCIMKLLENPQLFHEVNLSTILEEIHLFFVCHPPQQWKVSFVSLLPPLPRLPLTTQHLGSFLPLLDHWEATSWTTSHSFSSKVCPWSSWPPCPPPTSVSLSFLDRDSLFFFSLGKNKSTSN
jgi:hypothetical protein